MNLDSKRIYDYICSTVRVPQNIDSQYLVDRNEKSFSDSKDQHSFQYSWEFCGQDLSNCNIDLSYEEFESLSFDDNTVFSLEQQAKYHPQELLDAGKQFSTELETLFNKGITGRGIKVGIIDTKFNFNDPEFQEQNGNSRVVFSEDFYPQGYTPENEGFHGRAVASLLAGSQSGIVPEAQLYLFNSRDCWEQGERLDILKFILDNNIKLDVLCMASFFQDSPESRELIQKLKERGITFIDSSAFWNDFSYGRAQGVQVKLDNQLQQMYNNRHLLNGKRRELLEELPSKIIIPSAGRTHSQIGGGYKYNGVGCASWSIPQVAGLYCLARQLDKDLSYEKFINSIKETASQQKNGFALNLLEATQLIEKNKQKRLDSVRKVHSDI